MGFSRAGLSPVGSHSVTSNGAERQYVPASRRLPRKTAGAPGGPAPGAGHAGECGIPRRALLQHGGEAGARIQNLPDKTACFARGRFFQQMRPHLLGRHGVDGRERLGFRLSKRLQHPP